MGSIQEAVQVLAEYREKIKILENEKETLRNEEFIKQKNLMVRFSLNLLFSMKHFSPSPFTL